MHSTSSLCPRASCAPPCPLASHVLRGFLRSGLRLGLRAWLLCVLGLTLFCTGGCAMLPLALTTTASFAVPKTASLAFTGVKKIYETAQLAADERDMNTIVRDNMLTLKAKSALLTERSAADVHVYAYNGDIFAVGIVDNEAQRNQVIRTLQGVKGVDEVKGVLRMRDLEHPYAGLKDNYLETTTRMALSRYVLHKNSGIEINAVQGELCLGGVVGTYAEALDLIQYVESVSGTRALSLLAIRDEYATGKRELNERYLLKLDPEHAPPRLLAEAEPSRLPAAPVISRSLKAEARHAEPVVWNKARVRLGAQLHAAAKNLKNPTGKAELLTLAQQVTTDQGLSIADRLSVAAVQATNPHARLKIQSLLALY